MAFHTVVFSGIVFFFAFSCAVSAAGYNKNKLDRQPIPYGSHHRKPAPADSGPSRAENNLEWQWINPELGASSPGQSGRYVVQPPSEFSYTAHGGSENWPALFGGCRGKHQSPIKIHPRYSHNIKAPLLKFKHYWDNENVAEMNNTGKRVDVILIGNRIMPTLSGGPLTSEYEFAELHFHWGKNDKEGSEHTLDKLAFPMEAHLVHFKKEYGDVKEAANHPDGFAVVAFFFKIDKKNNKELSDLTAHLKQIKRAFSTYELPSASDAFHWFKDGVTQGPYFSYQGSLTTPPCSEVVTWIIYRDAIEISKHQMEEFRNLHSPDGKHIIENHRVIQPYVNPNLAYVL